MRKILKNAFLKGFIYLVLFGLITCLLLIVDVKPVGPKNTNIGFSTINTWFHQKTGVHWLLYTITDWLGLVPLAVCFCFGFLGLIQWIKRKRILKVDADILLLGGYYILIIVLYFLFEMVPLNYRPVLINGYLEVSYPSSTTLLVLSVMPTLNEQLSRRLRNRTVWNIISINSALFSTFMVAGRLLSGVHWLTDILASVFLSMGAFSMYQGLVYRIIKKEK